MSPALTISNLPHTPSITGLKSLPTDLTATASSVSPTPSPSPEACNKLPCAAKGPHQHPNAFEKLIQDITDILGPTSGLTTEGVDLEGLTRLMSEYHSNPEDWDHLAMPDLSRGYTRNLVGTGNGKYNLLLLVWSPDKGSMIHDHADAHCLMRILKGSLTESRYTLGDFCPDGETMEIGPIGRPIPKLIRRTVYAEGQTTYMSDDLGMHKISNEQSDIAVSLHLYTPPNAAREGCNVFCGRTGRKSHVEQNNYYSVMGVRSK